MSMANLGRVSEIWRWPLHYYRAVRAEYLKILTPAKDDGRMVERGPKGITIERYARER